MNKQKAIIFDLDGTLIDSLEDIAVCMNQVFEEFNLPTHEIKEYRNFVGGGIDVLVETSLGDSASKDIKTKVKNRFKEIYDGNLHDKTKPYEGIYELLDELQKQGFKIGVLSNKPHEFTVKYVDSLFYKYNLEEVHGQKSHIPKKPDPSAAINIANSFEIACENTYFVGDTNVDMKTAKHAKMIGIGVLWGFRPDELKEDAKFLVEKPTDILDIINHSK